MRRAAVSAIVLVCAATLSLCAEPIDRDALIRRMIDSRLLENAHFQVPVSVYQQYVREALLPAEPDPAPVGAIVEEAQFHISVPPEAEGKPLLKLTLRMRVFDPARVKQWPIFPPGVSWDKMTVNGQAGELPQTKGIFTWTAEAPLMDATAEGASLKLEAPRAVRTLVRFDSPRAWQVWDNVQGNWGPTGSAAKGTHQLLPAPTSGTVVLAYRRPRPVSQRPPRYELRGNIVWNLDAAGQQVTARLDVAIGGGRTDRIDLTLPPAAQRVRVTGPDVRQAQPGDGQVSVFLRGKIRDQTRLQVTYELPSPAGAALSFGRLGVRDGHWAGGCLIVTNTAGGSEVMAESAAGLAELPLWAIPRPAAAMLPGPAALAYEITGRDFSAAVELVDLGEFALRESIVDLAHFELLFRADGSVLCKGRYEVRNRSRQFLKLTTPPGSLVMTARVNDKPVPLSAVAGEAGAYRLPLVRSLGSVQGLVSFPVEVVLLWRAAGLKAGRGQIELPLPRVDIPIAYAWCQTYVPKGMKVRQWSGPLRSVEKYSSETATAYLGYGRGELAAGYDAKDRLKMVTAPPPARQPRSDMGKPSTKPAKPKPTKRPTKPSLPTPLKPAATPKGPVKRGPGVVGALSLPPAAQPQARPPAPTEVAGPQGQPGRPTGKMALSLARNYYRSGNEFYASNDFSGAATAFNKVLELAPGSAEGNNARMMLGNIRLARGELALRTKGEKAAAAKVRLAQREALRPVLEQRRQAIQAAQKALAAGEGELARAQLQVADALARQSAVTTRPAWRGRASAGGGSNGIAYRDGDARKLGRLRERLEIAELQKVRRLADQYQQLKAAGKHEEALKAGYELRISASLSGKSVTKIGGGGRLTLGGATLTEGTYRGEGDLSVDSNAALVVTHGARATTQPARTVEDLDQELKQLALQTAKKKARRRLGTLEFESAPGSGQAPHVDEDARRLNKLLQEPRSVHTDRASLAAARTLDTKTVKVILPEGADAMSVADALEQLHRSRLEGDGSTLQETVTSDDLRAEALDDGAVLLTGPKDKIDRALATLSRIEVPQAERPMKAQLAMARKDVKLSPDRTVDLSSRGKGTYLLNAAAPEDIRRLGEFDVRAGAEATPATAPAATGPRQAGFYVMGEVTKPEDMPVVGRAFGAADEKQARLREEQKQVADVRRAEVPGYETLRYPRDWEQITARRDQPSEMAEPTEAKPADEGRIVVRTSADLKGGITQLTGAPASTWEAGGGSNVDWDEGVWTDTAKAPRASKPDADRQPPTRVYDIRDLIFQVPNFPGPSIQLDSEGGVVGGWAQVGGEFAQYDKTGGTRTKLGEEELIKSIKEVIESAGLPDGAQVQILNGKLVVSGPGYLQAATGELLNELRKARGPQVEAGGERLAEQRARGVVTNGKFLEDVQADFATYEDRDASQPARGLKRYGWVSWQHMDYGPHRDAAEAPGSEVDAPPADGRVRKFIEANYDWALNQPAADGGWTDLVEALGRNLQQKVVVNSTNLNVDAPTAGRLGVRFVAGRNNTNLAVVDEAQLRTLLELDARRAGKASAVAANVRLQETIVGTDALLANGMIGNAAFAFDRGNTLDVNGNSIRLRHEQYVLINNGTYLTAVRVGPMQHWTEPAADVRFAEVGQEIDVPRVGRLVKFEKTLVQPTDNLIIRASYQWKGDAR